jgi:hypothetical protein
MEKHVADRLNAWQDCLVTVRVSWGEIGMVGGDTFQARVGETIPMGREYFVSFTLQDGKRRMIRSTSIVEIREV